MDPFLQAPTIEKFMASNTLYRGIMGPVGSGKSSACCIEIMKRAQQQKPNKFGIRKSRFVVIRNTYRELSDTTIKTWKDWFPESIFGSINANTMSQSFYLTLADESGKKDGTKADVEILFRALDRPQDIKKVLSMELTGAWINEAREVPKGIVDALGDRVGRYPSKKEGGCTWHGVIMDTNPPDDDHWWYRLAEVERPEGWEFFKQPGGVLEIGGRFVVNPDAENIENLPDNYYQERMAGKTPGYIRVYYGGRYGFVQDGKPVIPEYVDSLHCSAEVLRPVPGLVIWVGIDFGLTPAAIFGQRYVNGRWVWIDELVTEDMGAVRFGELLLAKLNSEYQGFEFDIWGDPAGSDRVQTDERTPFQILNAMGIPAKPAHTNDFELRREAIAVPLSRIVDGKPGLIVSPKCVVTRKGLAGGYCYKRVQIAGQERFHDKPDKNRYSHPVEAGGYLMVGGGEGKALIKPHSDEPVVVYQRPVFTKGTWMSR